VTPCDQGLFSGQETPKSALPLNSRV